MRVSLIKNMFDGNYKQVRYELLTITDVDKLTRRNGWTFGKKDWQIYFNVNHVYPIKMLCQGSDRIEGIIVYEERSDISGLFILWLESAPHNRKYTGNKQTEFDYIGENLIAYVCKRSEDLHYNFLALQSKGNPYLDQFYIRLGFEKYPFNRYMGLSDSGVKRLIYTITRKGVDIYGKSFIANFNQKLFAKSSRSLYRWGISKPSFA